MRTDSIGLNDISDITKALVDWDGKANYFQQLDNKQESLKEYCETLIKRYSTTYIDNKIYRDWNKHNLYYVKQMWGNTSCGWGGVGGAAMSESYTLILDNLDLKLVCVYYNGQLAYIAHRDEKFLKFLEGGFRSLPGLTRCKDSLNIIYKNNR